MNASPFASLNGGISINSKNKLESHTVLRLPPSLAEEIRRCMNGEEEDNGGGFTVTALSSEELQLLTHIDEKVLQGRLFNFNFKGNKYPAVLWDLPCIVETHKTVDHKHYVKSGDVGQMLKVGNLDASWESILPKVPNDQEKKGDESKSKRKELEKLRTQQERAFKSKNGLTPPTANIINRIYKHTSWDKKFDNSIVEKTETELILTAQAGEGGYPPPLIIEEVVEEPATMHNWPDTDDKIVLTGYESVKEYMRKAQQAEEVRMAAITKSTGKKAGSAFESGSYASHSPFHEGETPGDNDRDDIFETKSTGGYGKDLNDSRSVGSGGFPSSKSVNMDFASDINTDVFASVTQPSTFRGASPSPGPATVTGSAPSGEKDRDKEKEKRLKEKEVEKETPVYTQPLPSPPPSAPVVDTTANANAEALAKLTEEEKTLREEVRVKTQETEKALRDMNEMANPMLRKLKAEPAYNKALAAQKEAEARLTAVLEQINKL